MLYVFLSIQEAHLRSIVAVPGVSTNSPGVHTLCALQGILDFIVSFLVRICIKVVADNTCIVQFRHPNEEGGIYWSLSMVAAFAVTLGSVYLFEIKREELLDGGSELSVSSLWSVTLGLAGVWMISFATLLAMMEPKYRTTFFSTQTGWQSTQSHFKDGKADAVKADIFNNNVKQWKKDIGEDVKAWVGERWDTWMEERPEWLTDALKAKIPIEYIPVQEDKVEEEKRRESIRVSQRRRSSLGGIIVPKDSIGD